MVSKLYQYVVLFVLFHFSKYLPIYSEEILLAMIKIISLQTIISPNTSIINMILKAFTEVEITCLRDCL